MPAESATFGYPGCPLSPGQISLAYQRKRGECQLVYIISDCVERSLGGESPACRSVPVMLVCEVNGDFIWRALS